MEPYEELLIENDLLKQEIELLLDVIRDLENKLRALGG
jgi:hypothetical protein